MESTPGELSGNTEDVTGRKKSRFKFLKGRLFGRLKKKETEGRMKQSQSTGDVTAQEGGRGEDDSEDECQYPEGTLGSRALSHDSIFLADQVQSSQPTRVLSQENVHSKIKALQLKLQQQNIQLAPPLMIPRRRIEDSGATSEDDGLPHSPPEMSFQEVAMQKGASKYPEVKNNLSWLSLTGTGSEEEEQNLYRPRSSSMNSLDLPLSETEETQQSITPTQIVQPFSETSEHSTQSKEPVSLPYCANLQEELGKEPQLDDNPLNNNYRATELFHHEDRTNTTSECSDEITVLHASKKTIEPLAKEPSNDNQYKTKIYSLIPLSICPLDITSDYNVIKPKTAESLAASNTEQIESLCTTVEGDFSKPHPVPVPRTKKPANLNNDRFKELTVKHTDVEKEKASPSSPKEEDKPLRPSSFRFNIASAKYRSKTSDENVSKQDEQRSGNTLKGQVENTKYIEVCRKSPTATDKRSSLWREVIGQSVSKTGLGDNAERSEECSQNTEYLQSEKAEESEDRKGLFGVKLRSTSLSLRYRSELPKSDAELKRHSLESHHLLAVKEPVSSDVEAVSNDRKTNVLSSSSLQSLDSKDPIVDKGSETDSRPEPAWRSLTREKAKVHQSSSIKPSTQPSPSPSLSTSQSSSTQQLSKPPLQPRPPLPATSKPQPANPPTTAPRAVEKVTVSNQREEKSSVSQATHRQEQMEFKCQSKLGVKSNTQTEPDQQSPSDRAQPTWMELAKRKSLAWSDKSLDSINF
ncbi:hypothetical protein HF521_012917 [Silurus meridionalis]|uniref:DUF4592 domain-containing protein n=1 Tax=Silurus meridionalis TaxID=175797 RepID=A0A8T0ABR7_SILME|nr:hypothetical protein HF521_012917 [Silurus meridionalis]